jgi:hypothetical protein
MTLVDEIRKKYPVPISSVSGIAWLVGTDSLVDGTFMEAHGIQGYCVLGAAMMFLCPALKVWTFADCFPLPSVGAKMLGIPFNKAAAIVDRNDTGNFDAAWSLLDQALSNRLGGTGAALAMSGTKKNVR